MSDIRHDLPIPPRKANPNSVASKMRELQNMPVGTSIELFGYEPTVRATAYRFFGSGGYAMRAATTPGAWRVWRAK